MPDSPLPGCADVLELVDQVKERVFRETGVELELEVKVLK